MIWFVDENLPAGLADVLVAAGLDAVAVVDEPGAGTKDPDLLKHVAARGGLLLTQDRVFRVKAQATVMRKCGSRVVVLRWGGGWGVREMIWRIVKRLDEIEAAIRDAVPAPPWVLVVKKRGQLRVEPLDKHSK